MTAQYFDGMKSYPISVLSDEGWSIDGELPKEANDVVKLRKAVAVLYRCIELRANHLSALPWQVRKGETVIYSSDESDVPSALPWLANLPDLLALTEKSLLLTSTAYWLKERNRVKLLSLRWLAPVSMTPKWDESNGLTGYERMLSNGRKETFGLDDVIYTWFLDPMHETQPDVPPAQAAMTAAGVLYSVGLFTNIFLQRGAIKGTLLTVEGNPAPQEKQRLKEWWKRFYSGAKNAGAAEVVSSGVKPVVIGEGLSELSHNELTGENREDIATALGIPHSLVFSNSSNFATSVQDKKNFYDDTIVPESKFIAKSLNRQLFTSLGYQFRFMPETLDIYQEDEEKRAQSLAALVGAGFKLSMAAEMLGFELPQGVEYADLDEEEPEPEPQPVVMAVPPTDDTEDVDEPNPTEQAKALRSADLDKWRRKALKRLASGKPAAIDFESDYLSEIDRAHYKHMLAHAETDEHINLIFGGGGIGQDFFTESLKATLSAGSDGSDKERKKLEKLHTGKIHDALLTLRRKVAPLGTTPENITPDIAVQRMMEHKPVLRDAMVAMLLDAAHLGVEVGIAQVEEIMGVGKAAVTGVNWDLVNEAVLEWVTGGTGGTFGTGYTDEVGYADSIMVALIRTNERQIRRAIGEWVTNGLSFNDLVSQLERTVFSERRAEIIATTEITRAYAEGNRQAWQASNVINQMQWQTGADERVCPVCGPLQGRRVPLGGDWGGYFPPAHPRCRCFLLPVVVRH